jgi:non-ribosomal peptide synthase protein (TIGR01720 family)
LAQLWADVLGVERVGVHDNFFELGGDSILAIQVTARANAAGLRLTPRQLFQFPTISDLAAVSGSGPVVDAEQGIVEGPVPLTPIQRWFVDLNLPQPHHWNQALLLRSRDRLEPRTLEAAVSALLQHHDALRLRLEPRQSEWIQTNSGVDGVTPFSSCDLSHLSPTAQTAQIESMALDTQASLDLREGPLIRVAHFDLGPGRGDRLMFAIHHLAVDGVSWRILLEDFQTAYELVSAHETVVLPAKTTSFKQWAERLSQAAEAGEFAKERGYWAQVCEGTEHELPVDFADGANSQASEQRVVVALTPDETRALIRDVPPIYGTEIVDALLAALAQAFAQWTGSRTLFIDVEGHGREPLFEELDVSRTVGWFTTIYPVRLELEGIEWPGEALKAVKEHLRRVPQRGIGYGVLQHLSSEPANVRHLGSPSQPLVSFNYLGQFNELIEANAALTLAPELPGPSRAPTGERPYLLNIDGGVIAGRLEMTWSYSDAVHHQETIKQVADAFIEGLRHIIEHCRTRESVGYTPSDFPDVELSQAELDMVMSEISELPSDGDM